MKPFVSDPDLTVYAGDGLGRLLVDLIRECADEIGHGVDRREEWREHAYAVLRPEVLAAETRRAKKRGPRYRSGEGRAEGARSRRDVAARRRLHG